jgi:two-component system, chemotaxis family, response regulator PixG
MMNSLNVVHLLQEVTANERSGELTISNNDVTWQLYLTGTTLHCATHSLQNLDALEQLIQQFEYAAALPLRQKLAYPPETLPLHTAIYQLRDTACLDQNQASHLITALTEAALELVLWLPQAEHHWQEQSLPIAIQSSGQPWPPLLESLAQRRDTWKSLAPVITTPEQCPRCDDLRPLSQSAAIGMLPASILEMIAKLMQGISLRQLAALLRQDVLKLCQLLYPYINQGILRLEAAPAPFNTLPLIPPSDPIDPVPVNSTIDRPEYSRDTYSRDTYSRDTYSRDTYSRDTYSRDSVSVQLAPPVVKAKTYKVVCIDDSPTILERIQSYLGTDRFEVATVENPMASMSALFDMKPDLILMDVSMPGIDGNRLCQILKRSSVFTNVPIIMVSGNTGLLDKEKAKAAGATDYLTKPFSQEELLSMVEQYLTFVS